MTNAGFGATPNGRRRHSAPGTMRERIGRRSKSYTEYRALFAGLPRESRTFFAGSSWVSHPVASRPIRGWRPGRRLNGAAPGANASSYIVSTVSGNSTCETAVWMQLACPNPHERQAPLGGWRRRNVIAVSPYHRSVLTYEWPTCSGRIGVCHQPLPQRRNHERACGE